MPLVSSAASPNNPSGAKEPLTYPEYKPTPLSTQSLSLAYLMMQWNAPVPGGFCCWLHGALNSLDKVRNELSRRPCNQRQDITACGQCDDCGLLLIEGQSSCEFCEDQSSRDAYMSDCAAACPDDITNSEEVLSV